MFTKEKVKSLIKHSLILFAVVTIVVIFYNEEMNKVGEISFYTPLPNR